MSKFPCKLLRKSTASYAFNISILPQYSKRKIKLLSTIEGNYKHRKRNTIACAGALRSFFSVFSITRYIHIESEHMLRYLQNGDAIKHVIEGPTNNHLPNRKKMGKTLKFCVNFGINYFDSYAKETLQILLLLYSWYCIPVTVHKILIHEAYVIKKT